MSTSSEPDDSSDSWVFRTTVPMEGPCEIQFPRRFWGKRVILTIEVPEKLKSAIPELKEVLAKQGIMPYNPRQEK